MNRLIFSFIVFSMVFFISCSSKPIHKKAKNGEERITFIENSELKRIDVLADGKPFTTFQWPGNICKPILYPVFASSGTEITRGFPVNPKPGERADHPHQIGIWLTYGNVNGNDFWGNGSQGLGTKNPNGGLIEHLKIDKIQEGTGKGIIISSEKWMDATGSEILREKTEYHFMARGKTRIIDRITTLTAGKKDILIPDTKEGMFGIRVARQLELPIKGTAEIYNIGGTISKVKDTFIEGITGNYTSSEAVKGEEVWGTRAKWMRLDGNIDLEKISLVICDHPKNPNYPTYWHARGYGLLSANPLGVKDFTKGVNSLNFSIPAGNSVTFRYRVIIVSDSILSEMETNALCKDFSEKY